jgi:hypothetical protein
MSQVSPWASVAARPELGGAGAARPAHGDGPGSMMLMVPGLDVIVESGHGTLASHFLF